MHINSCITLLCTTLFISTSNAAPRYNKQSSGLEELPDNARTKSGTVPLRKPHRGYGKKRPQANVEALQNAAGVETNEKAAVPDSDQLPSKLAKSHGTGAGKVNTWPANDGAEYLCEVTIGGQKLHMNIDTGSSDL